MNIEKIKAIQRILGVVDDGIFGPKSRAALEKILAPTPPSDDGWHEGKASSFADPADVRAFRRCKAQGKSDQECFKVGDNGIGKWGMDTTQPVPMCALPREDWAHLDRPQGTLVIVEANGQTVRAELQDTMPARANIKNGAVIDLNPEACARLGLTPPVLVAARWRWA
jgi:hypothetical protein